MAILFSRWPVVSLPGSILWCPIFSAPICCKWNVCNSYDCWVSSGILFHWYAIIICKWNFDLAKFFLCLKSDICSKAKWNLARLWFCKELFCEMWLLLTLRLPIYVLNWFEFWWNMHSLNTEMLLVAEILPQGSQEPVNSLIPGEIWMTLYMNNFQAICINCWEMKF